MIKRYFITGTDTNIGKTIAACALLQTIVRTGCRAIGYKPVASGCHYTDEGLRHNDALALMANSNVLLPYHQINPLTFLEPTSPHLASFNEGRSIDASVLSVGLRVLEGQAEWLVIEGAGGWFTPLGHELLYSDWVAAEQLPVILVVGIKLGCINHALLTALAVQQAGLLLVGWIINHHLPIKNLSNDYLVVLQDRLDAPLLGEIPWLQDNYKAKLDNYLNLKLLDT